MPTNNTKSFNLRSFKFELKHKVNTIKKLFKSYCFWHWRKNTYLVDGTNSIGVKFLGNVANHPLLIALLGLVSENSALHSVIKNEILITDFPLPNALRIPATLTTLVPLSRSIEEILASYGRSLRRSIVGQRNQYRYETVDTLDKITAINDEMLKPYANARHESAHHLDLDTVTNLAISEYGRLDLLYLNEEAVGCHLGNFYERQGKSYWRVNRFGYPAKIYSDYKLWGEVNSMNLHLALETAINGGYDFCDYGASLARPGAGLIEWKRRRKGFLVEDEGIDFYLKFPKSGAQHFFWHSPLFNIENHKVVLHLGVPEGKTDTEIMARYHEMGYGGLHKVYLHCNRPLDETLMQFFRDLYADQESPPSVITYETS